MTLNLLPMPYMLARKIIYWCWEHDIDRQQCGKIIQAMTEKGGSSFPDSEWVLEVPDKYATWFMLKWGLDVNAKDSVES